MKNETVNQPPPITQLEFNEADFAVAERMAKRMGFTQTAYTSTSALWGLYCLADGPGKINGCVIKTQEFGLMFVADREDLGIE
jgi:hypothetical protein